MKTKTIELYSFDELSNEAKKKAHKDWVNGKDDYFFLSDCMSDCMKERCYELLQDNKITPCKDGLNDDYGVHYSLSYNQGDGAMFYGRFTYKKYYIVIKHIGRYYHYNSKDIEMYHEPKGTPVESEKVLKDFDALYVSICKQLEQYGHDWIEYDDSMEHFTEECAANEWTFTKEGELEIA